MSDDLSAELSQTLHDRHATFQQKLVAMLIYVRQFPEAAAFLGVSWVHPGSNEFYSSATIIAQRFGLTGSNSVCVNFRQHHFQIRKATRANPVKIPAGLPDPKRWKIRFHPDMWYNCDNSEIETMKWEKPRPGRKVASAASAIDRPSGEGKTDERALGTEFAESAAPGSDIIGNGEMASNAGELEEWSPDAWGRSVFEPYPDSDFNWFD
jgi:hypothetical protein